MSKCDSFDPLSPREVASTAKNLEDLGRRFVEGDKPRDVAQAWHAELEKLYLRGEGSVQKVFDKMQDDSNASSDPNFPKIIESYKKDPAGGLTKWLDVNPPSNSDSVYPALSAGIDNGMILSEAMLSEDDFKVRSTTTGRMRLSRKLCWDEK